MLSISKASLDNVNYYLELAAEDYYIKGGEPPGEWHGKGCDALGLKGKVEDSAFRNLFYGFSPDGETALVKNAGQLDGYHKRVPAWDLTFSVPKSVSVFWSQAPEDVRHQIEELTGRAVRFALTQMEENAGLTRRGKGGKIWEKAALVFALFEHGTSRELDPQLHVHALAFNFAMRFDGTTWAIRCNALYEYKMAVGALFRCELAALLERHLNLGIEPVESWFEIKEVSQQLREDQSTRRKQILEHCATNGNHSARAAEMAALETRAVKTHVARELLFPIWKTIGEAHAWSEAQVVKLLKAQPIQRNFGEEKERLFNSVQDELRKDNTRPSNAKLIELVAQRAQGSGLDASQVLDVVQTAIENQQTVAQSTSHEKAKAVTQQTSAQESKLVARAQSGEHQERGAEQADRGAESTPKDLSTYKSEPKVDNSKLSHQIGQQKKEATDQNPTTRSTEPVRNQSFENVERATHRASFDKMNNGQREQPGAAPHQSEQTKESSKTWWQSDKTASETNAKPNSTSSSKQKQQTTRPEKAKPKNKLAAIVKLNDAPNAKGLGAIQKRINFRLFTLEYRDKYLFPKAPRFNDASKWKMPSLKLRPNHDPLKIKAKITHLLEKKIRVSRDPFEFKTKITIMLDQRRQSAAKKIKHLVASALKRGASFVVVDDQRRDAFFTSFNRLAKSADVSNWFQRPKLLAVKTNKQMWSAILQDWKKHGLELPEKNLMLTQSRATADRLNSYAQKTRLKEGKITKSSVAVGDVRIHWNDRVLFRTGYLHHQIGIDDLGTVTKLTKTDLHVALDNGKQVKIPFSSNPNVALAYALAHGDAGKAKPKRAFILYQGNDPERELSAIEKLADNARVRIHARADLACGLFERIEKTKQERRHSKAEDFSKQFQQNEQAHDEEYFHSH